MLIYRTEGGIVCAGTQGEGFRPRGGTSKGGRLKSSKSGHGKRAIRLLAKIGRTHLKMSDSKREGRTI